MLIFTSEASIVAMQETKLSANEDAKAFKTKLARCLDGWDTYWNTSTARSGYSGVCCWTKRGLVVDAWDWFVEPCIEACPLCQHLSREGRVLILDCYDFVLINVYVPNGGKEKSASGENSMPYKNHFLLRLEREIAVLRERGRKVVLVGDLNVIADPQDIYYDLKDYNAAVKKGEPCMSTEVALWLKNLLSSGMVDTFRTTHPTCRAYTWFDMKSDARERGKFVHLKTFSR